MKERPILFSAPMILALLAGTKTQTRRLCPENWLRCLDPDDGPEVIAACVEQCPYGELGDRLWVRETFASFANATRVKPTLADYVVVGDGTTIRRDHAHINPPVGYDPARVKWRPSIHMPRWASRILLEVTEVRLERLQSITEADARAEGVALPTAWEPGREPTHRHEYAKLWDSLNAERAPWSANPWVWVITFRRVTP